MPRREKSFAFVLRMRSARHWKGNCKMATLLSKIFGKKSVQPERDNDELDISALKPLMQPKAAVSTDPKDLSGAWTMEQVTTIFPSSQRAMFQKYHIGGCSSCGFQPMDTLGTVAM